MTQDEIEQRLSEMSGGDPSKLKYTKTTKKIDNPVSRPGAPGFDTNAPPQLELPVETWQDTKTGAVLSISRHPDGAVQVEKDSAPNPQTRPAAARAADRPRQLPANTTARTIETQNPDNTITSRPNENYVPPKPPKPGPAERPQTVQASATDPYIVTRQPDGSLAADRNPNYQGAKPTAPHVTTFDGDLVSIDANGNLTTLKKGVKKAEIVDLGNGRKGRVEADGSLTDVTPERPGALGVPKGVSRYTPDYTSSDLGIEARRDELNRYVQAGVMTADQATAVLESDYKMAEVMAKHGGTLAADQRGIYGDQITQRGQSLRDTESRRTSATNVYDTALGQFMQGGGKVLPGKGGDSAAAFMTALEQGRSTAERWGGMRDVPEIDIPPWLQGVRDAPPPGGPPLTRPVDPNLPMTALVAGPAPGAATAVTNTSAGLIGGALNRPAAAPAAAPVFAVVAPAPPPRAAAVAMRPVVAPGQAGMMSPNSPTVDPSLPAVPVQPTASGRAADFGYTSPEGPPLTPAQLGALIGTEPVPPDPRVVTASPGYNGYDPNGPTNVAPPQPGSINPGNRLPVQSVMSPAQQQAFFVGAVPSSGGPPAGMPIATYARLRTEHPDDVIEQAWAEHLAEMQQPA